MPHGGGKPLDGPGKSLRLSAIRVSVEPFPDASPMAALSPRPKSELHRRRISLGIPWLQRVLAVGVFGILLAGILDYPTGRFFLAGGLAVYVFLGLRYRGAWLCAFPALLPVLNLAPWSGRVFFEEFDLFLLATVGIALWQGLYDYRRRLHLSLVGGTLILGFSVSVVWAMLNGLLPLETLDANSFSSYYSHYNALRLARAFLWALLLVPPLFGAWAEDEEKARHYLTAGILLGLLGTGMAVVWERGFFIDLLYGQNRYALFQSLLDFSTTYRITALFSEMHTGGEAIDGYLALAWPFAVYGLFKGRDRGWIVASGVALVLGLYSAMVTFSRGTYLALAVGASVFALGAAVRLARRESPWRMGLGILGIAGVGALAMIAFRQGGILALGAVVFGFALTAVLGFLGSALGLGRLGAGGALALALPIAVMVKAQLSSKWVVHAGFGEAFGTALALGLGVFALGTLLGRLARRSLDLRGFGTLVALVGTGLAVLVPPVLGSRMETRFADVTKDYGTRTAHWLKALDMMDGDGGTKLLGMGLGSFPRTYLLNRDQDEGGTFSLQGETGNTYLQMSGSQDLRLGQRVDLPAGGSYLFSMDYRTRAEAARLYVRVCRRNIIQLMEWNPECRTFSKTVPSTQGKWEHIDWRVDIGDLGTGYSRLGRRPLTLEIMNRREYELMFKPIALVDFDNIGIQDEFGNERVDNGDFSKGMDHWFPYCDFNHLPWHIKNIWVDLYFEQGFLGLVTFIGLLGYGLAKTVHAIRRDDGFALAVLASLSGFLSVGLIGTLLDVPRIMVLFYLLLFTFFPKPRRERRGEFRYSPR